MQYQPPEQIGSTGDSLREAFGKALVACAPDFPNLIVLDADVAGGTGTHHFRHAFADRFLQMGIAEQNMMGVAAGLAAVGWLPVFTTFAVFCLRAFEQARLSVAYSGRNVKIVASHPGVDAGPDGGSVQALEDLAAFRALPGMVVVSPADALEMEQATRAVLQHTGPVYMRSGRSPAPRILPADYRFELGRGRVLRAGDDVLIVACGVEVARALDAAERLYASGIRASVVNMATIKPIDAELLIAQAQRCGCVVTAEDHTIHGGLGAAVAEVLVQHWPCPVEFIGVGDRFGESGEPGELAEKFQLTAQFIVHAAQRAVARKRRGAP